MRKLNRIDPKLPVTAYKTYQISAPIQTHYRQATCEEVHCGAYERGWKTQIDETTELGQRQAYYIRKQSGRRFVEEHNVEGLTDFVFAPGQRCFQSDKHVVSLDRPANYVVRGGDWRGHLGNAVKHTKPEHWVEDFQEHQDKLATTIQRG